MQIGKRVETMADEFANNAPNTFVKVLEFMGLVIINVGWYLSYM
jgi:hypothetical protein